ncbi:hypothetical protein J7E83_05170 [Arthrobacter sp. ISL-48]|uniref:hypothetical protein n=1 Tax=Arthrobacter sp. ISL-48 TaxID=2819110 RepID=UPI001BEAE1C4|nr:hypothetical protein [Arthrobacter sp. ISL-48]MBT2531529.1 hypothetical protein [Arthrobacter sp. ISL-48]
MSNVSWVSQMSELAQPGRVPHGPVDVDTAAMPDALAEGGRGRALAKAALDVLLYERHNGANHWTLRRTRTAS